MQARALYPVAVVQSFHAFQLAKCFCFLLQTDFVCRLVRGISLRKFLTDSCLPDLSDAPSILQHEHMVMEIAAQLLQVRMLSFAMLSQTV